MEKASDRDFILKVIQTSKIVSAFVVGLALIVIASDVLLLIFAGILFAIFLASLSEWISRYTPLSYGWSLAAVCSILLSLAAVGGVMMAPGIAEQAGELAEKIPQSIERIKEKIEHYSWANSLIEKADPEKMVGSGRAALSRATGVLSGLLGGLASIVIVVFVGLYGAVEPGLYKKGFLHLVPIAKRKRVSEVFDEINETLRWWLIGKLISMGIIGVMTTLGLWLMDVPLALILGIIAALLTFIPNVGPLLSAVPAVLLGLTESPERALYIALLYIGIQTVESYLITPLIQRKTIQLPPGLTLSSQVLLGVLFSGVGVALATPLTAVAIVATKRLYVEDALGEDLSK